MTVWNIAADSADALMKSGSALLLHNGAEIPPVVDSLSVGSSFGRAKRMTIELSPVSLHLTNPRKRLAVAAHRQVDSAFAAASAIGTLTGDFDVNYIGQFNRRASWFSDDGVRLPNSHGVRLAQNDQLEAVVSLLRRDPSSRRAMTTVYGSSDLRSGSKDVPCVSSLHFMCRDGLLNCVVNMRSQSAVMVFPYDVYAFTFIQEAVASELHLEVGSYHQLCNSYHIYDDEFEMASRFATESLTDVSEVPRMPFGGAFAYARSVQASFNRLNRPPESFRLIQRREIGALGLPSYWESMLSLMLVGAARLHGGDQPDIVDLIDDVHKGNLRPVDGR